MPAPAFIQSILSKFPLIEYEEQLVTASTSTGGSYPAAPSKPTLWVYGPGIGNERESFDLDCLVVQASAAFKGIELETRSLQLSEGAPGASLPALHLPNGDLLPTDSIPAWIAKQPASDSLAEQDQQQQASDFDKQRKDMVAVQTRTFTRLLESKLKAALLAFLFLNPKVYKRLAVPLYFPQTLSHETPDHPATPVLTRYAYSALASSYKMEVQAEIQKLISSTNRGGKLDLEEIIRGGQEAIDLLAEKLEGDGKGWYLGTEQPTSFDSLLYAHLHLVHLLHAPHLGAASPLRRRLERHDALSEWAKRLHKEYFSEP